jgi:hypothetical protein
MAYSSDDGPNWRPWHEEASSDSDEDPPSLVREVQAPLDPNLKLRSLGVFKTRNTFGWEYFEWKLKHLCWTTVTTHWPYIQKGTTSFTMSILQNLFVGLELNAHAIHDLILLGQSGIPGRAEFNYIIWCLCNVEAHQEPYSDLSDHVLRRVMASRRSFDRPPRQASKDMQQWGWLRLDAPAWPHWSPEAVPKECLNGSREVRTGPGGKPLPPPHCWPEDLQPVYPRLAMMGPSKLDLTKNPHFEPPKQARDPASASASSSGGFQWNTK